MNVDVVFQFGLHLAYVLCTFFSTLLAVRVIIFIVGWDTPSWFAISRWVGGLTRLIMMATLRLTAEVDLVGARRNCPGFGFI